MVGARVSFVVGLYVLLYLRLFLIRVERHASVYLEADRQHVLLRYG